MYPGREGVKGCRTFVKHVVDGALGFLEVPQNQHFQRYSFCSKKNNLYAVDNVDNSG